MHFKLALRQIQMVKQKKNNDINNTILAKESIPQIDKIDSALIPENPIKKEVVQPPIAKAPVVSSITKSKKLSLDTFDEDLKNTAAKTPTSTTESIIKEPIAIDEITFQEKWKSYVELIRVEQENAGLAMSLEQSTYSITNNILRIFVNSETTKELIEKDKVQLIEYISKAIDNDTINVHIEVSNQAQELNKKSLSPNDKLKLMMESNPAVVELIKLLNLEIDY